VTHIRVDIGGKTFRANNLESFQVQDVNKNLPDCARLEVLTDLEEVRRRAREAAEYGDGLAADWWQELAREMEVEQGQ